MDQTVECPICGEPYKVMPYYAGDQSACPDCVNKAMDKMRSQRSDRANQWRQLA